MKGGRGKKKEERGCEEEGERREKEGWGEEEGKYIAVR